MVPGTYLWCWERTYGAGNKELELVLAAHFQDIVQPFNINSHGERHVLFADGAE